MKLNIIRFSKLGSIAMAGLLLIVSCNKKLPDAEPITPLPTTQSTIGDIISNDTSYSIMKTAVNRVPLMMDSLKNNNNVFTVFLPNNAAFRLSGIASDAVMSVFPIANVTAIVRYHISGGQAFGSAQIPTTFPNLQLPTMYVLSAPFFRLSIFPSKRGAIHYANNIPITAVDMKASNGVINNVAAIVAPPSLLLAQIIYADTTLTYFTAAIARGDSGQVGTSRIDSLLRYAPVNMTVLAPNNTAMRAALDTNIRRGLIAQLPLPITPLALATAAGQATFLASSPTVFSNPALYGVLTANVVRGLVAYHILTSATTSTVFTPNIRAFSVNFSSTATFIPTLVNNSLAIHPGVRAVATFAPPFVTSLQFTGYGNLANPTATPYTGPAANAIVLDRHAVNGVTHTIDRVLIPQ